MDADVIVVGAGLAGLVATHELTSRGKKVALVDQENAANLGGQAFWSFGGIFLVDSPEQRRMRVKAPSSWPGTTGRAAPDSTASTTKTSGRRNGPAPTSSSPPGETVMAAQPRHQFPAHVGERFVDDRLRMCRIPSVRQAAILIRNEWRRGFVLRNGRPPSPPATGISPAWLSRPY